MARHSTAVDCSKCGITIGRKADLARHMLTHAENKEELMHVCPHIGCTYKTLQRSNLATHLNVHSRERPHKCPTAGCDFSCSDPGSLTRHRKELHGYEPKARSGSCSSASNRKAARQQRKFSPYTTSSSTSSSSSERSVSPLDSSSSMDRSPRSQMPQILDGLSPSSLSPADNRVKNRVKNTNAAYSTELITKLPNATDWTIASNPEPEKSFPPASETLTVQEARAVEYPELPLPEQGDVHTFDLPTLPVSQMTRNEISDVVFDNFLAQFDYTHPEAEPGYTPSSLVAPLVEYTVGNALMPVPIPASLPSYEGSYTIDNALYEPYGYSTEAVSLDAEFLQSYSFTASDMDIYPQVIDQSYFYAAPAGTSGFSTQGLYVY